MNGKRFLCATAILLLLALFTGCQNTKVTVLEPTESSAESGASRPVATPTVPDGSVDPTGSTSQSPSALPTEPSSVTDSADPTTSGGKTLVSKFNMLTAGDNLIHRGIMQEAQNRATGEENFSFDFLYENIKEQVTASDYAVINQESIILHNRYLPGYQSGNPKANLNKYYRTDVSFVTPVDMVDALCRAGFDAFDMANNHELDMGAAGLQWSLDWLNQNASGKILWFGGFYDEEDRAQIRVIEVNGIRVALLAYTYGTNVSTEIAEKEEGFRFLVPYIDDEKMVEELQQAKEVADFTVVFVHWGTEYSFEPDELQRHTAKVLAENGAGIIVGHHSHTLQPIEYIDDGKGGKVLCAYSLGTLVSTMEYSKNMLAGLFDFDLCKWDDGSVTVENPRLTPTVFYYDRNVQNNQLLYLKDLTPSLASSHGVGTKWGNEISPEQLYGYLHGVIEDEFLPEEYKGHL